MNRRTTCGESAKQRIGGSMVEFSPATLDGGEIACRADVRLVGELSREWWDVAVEFGIRAGRWNSAGWSGFASWTDAPSDRSGVKSS